MSHLSAIGHFHKMSKYEDPTRDFLVNKAVTGIRNLSKSRRDLRMPITRPVLQSLIRSLKAVVSDSYERKLLQFLFLLAFHAFLRIGEICSRSLKRKENVITLADLFVPIDRDRIYVTLTKFKHSAKQGAQSITVKAYRHKQFCPVRACHIFLKVRGSNSGPLFQFASGKPYTRRAFDTKLRQCLNFCGFSTSVYKGHSFRIGAATDAAERGCSDAQIRTLGRWASDAFKKYIRISGPTVRQSKQQ